MNWNRLTLLVAATSALWLIAILSQVVPNLVTVTHGPGQYIATPSTKRMADSLSVPKETPISGGEILSEVYTVKTVQPAQVAPPSTEPVRHVFMNSPEVQGSYSYQRPIDARSSEESSSILRERAEQTLPSHGRSYPQDSHFSSPPAVPVNVLPEVLVAQIDPASPGNTVSIGGQLVSVEGSAQSMDGTSTSLDVTVVPDLMERTSIGSQGQRESSHPTYSTIVRGGFSYEEELFRAKWGWAAFDKATRIAREAANETP